jgi:hypothetical protein
MGSGRYSTDVYDSTVGSTLRSGGDTFAHTTRTKSAPQEQWKVHDTLDPKTVAGPGSPFEGQIMRESRDSDEHPTSTPIAVIFDETGSMGQFPRQIQKELPALFEMLQLKGYVEHPQILFGGVGDAFSDRVPLQLGQFESDNRMDEQLGSIFLEGNGGGGGHESYDLALYFMARHTATDSFDKRGEKGYLVMIGDEFPYDQVTAAHVRKHIGDELDENISIEAIIAEVLEKWNVTFIIPDGRHVDNRWRELLGPENVHVLDDMGEITKVIADRIGQAEAAKKNSTATAAP